MGPRPAHHPEEVIWIRIQNVQVQNDGKFIIFHSEETRVLFKTDGGKIGKHEKWTNIHFPSVKEANSYMQVKQTDKKWSEWLSGLTPTHSPTLNLYSNNILEILALRQNGFSFVKFAKDNSRLWWRKSMAQCIYDKSIHI